MERKNKINFIPFISDMILLFVIFFISVIILQQIKLQHSEDIFNIETDMYFQSMEYDLSESNKNKLIKFIHEKKIVNSLYKKFKNKTLKEIRITGFADSTQPSQDISIYKRWKTNRELSFFRANTVCELLIEILEDSINATPDEIKEIKGKLLPAGYGEFNPWNEYDIERYTDISGEERYNFKSKNDTVWFYNKSKDQFIDWENEKNRRIEIKTIYNN